MKLSGSVCVVTGASSGIGRATAVELARAGATLALVSRNEAALRDVQALAPSSTVHPCDVSDADAVEAMTASVLQAHGRVDLLFANAGTGHFRPLVEMTMDEIESMVAVNVLGQMYCVRAILPHMMERRSGHLVIMSSTNGRIPPPLQSVYNATKFAAVGFGETLLYEVEPYGIGVTIVYPGAIDTAFFGPPEFASMRTPKKVPAQRMAAAIVRGIQKDAYDVTLPKALRFPAVIRAVAPPLIRSGVRRYAASVVPRPKG
jgi:short-subunit dehydrogenase